MPVIYLDFETRSKSKLRDVGAHRYFEDPSTDIICLAYAYEDRDVRIWTPKQVLYAPLYRKIAQKDIRIYAWNASFDRLAWNTLMHGRYGWPYLPVELWHDPQAVAAYRNYPIDLASAAVALKLKDKKMDSGTRLINWFSKPNRHNEFNEPLDHPDKYEELLAYARRDVDVLRSAHKKLGDLPPREREIWLHTEKINDRGIHIDAGACRNIVGHIENKRKELNTLVRIHTGGEITAITQRDRIQQWLLNQHNLKLPDMQGSTIEYALAELDKLDLTLDHRRGRTLLTWYQQGNKSSLAKYQKILNQLCKDQTVKGFLFYHGAGTGRYSGRGVQFQNFPNKTLPNVEWIIDTIQIPETDFVELMVGDMFEVSKKLLRSVIKAPPGHFFCVADYKSIEAVATAWVCGERDILQAFVRGEDQYRLMAAKMWGIDYKQVTDDQRTAGKITVLACGFGGHATAIQNMAVKMGLDITEKKAVEWAEQFRAARPRLVQMWQDIEQLAKWMLIKGKEDTEYECSARGMTLRRVGDDLRIVLPSKREINYPEAATQSEIGIVTYLETDGDGVCTVKSVDDLRAMNPRPQWGTRALYGSLMFQNYVQGLCRDILVDAQLRLEENGFPVVINVHDELGSIVDKNDEYTSNLFRSLMTRRPLWLADDFPILADGYIARRYKK